MIDSNLNELLRKTIGKSTIDAVNREGGFYVAGGCITSLVTRGKVNDIDMYFPSREAVVCMIQMLDEEGWWCTFTSDKSATFTNKAEEKLQLIYYDFYESPEAIFDHFDFTINMAAWNSLTGNITYHKDFMLHNSQRYLQYNHRTKFPLISLLRVKKYQDRGYYISKSEFMKIGLSLSQLNISSWEELKSHCGNTYGTALLEVNQEHDVEFSMDRALEMMDSLKFKDEDKIPFLNHKIGLETLEKYILSGDKVKVFEYEGSYFDSSLNKHSKSVVSSHRSIFKVEDINNVIGDYLYKYVSEDLKAPLYKHYQYKIGEVCNGGPSGLYFLTEDLLKDSSYRNKGNTVLKVKYKKDDIIDIFRENIKINEVFPVEAIDKNTYFQSE